MTVKPCNFIAKALQSPLFRSRVLKPKKGKGSYKRKGKYHEDRKDR